mmetsp:Transcript_22100/g.42172  ORF Transcript_22100/g.42172 Transcript_22100/m.42172 type:complete len:448 (+) Transcript_22100:344-1687(+)
MHRECIALRIHVVSPVLSLHVLHTVLTLCVLLISVLQARNFRGAYVVYFIELRHNERSSVLLVLSDAVRAHSVQAPRANGYVQRRAPFELNRHLVTASRQSLEPLAAELVHHRQHQGPDEQKQNKHHRRAVPLKEARLGRVHVQRSKKIPNGIGEPADDCQQETQLRSEEAVQGLVPGCVEEGEHPRREAQVHHRGADEVAQRRVRQVGLVPGRLPGLPEQFVFIRKILGDQIECGQRHQDGHARAKGKGDKHGIEQLSVSLGEQELGSHVGGVELVLGERTFVRAESCPLYSEVLVQHHGALEHGGYHHGHHDAAAHVLVPGGINVSILPDKGIPIQGSAFQLICDPRPPRVHNHRHHRRVDELGHKQLLHGGALKRAGVVVLLKLHESGGNALEGKVDGHHQNRGQHSEPKLNGVAGGVRLAVRLLLPKQIPSLDEFEAVARVAV